MIFWPKTIYFGQKSTNLLFLAKIYSIEHSLNHSLHVITRLGIWGVRGGTPRQGAEKGDGNCGGGQPRRPFVQPCFNPYCHDKNDI